jgi:hypothetical protein
VIEPARANAVIAAFAAETVHATHRERRVAMSSPLYDLAGRSSLGFAAVHEVAPGMVERLDPVLGAERIGERMGTVLTRPYFLQLFIFFYAYLMGREQRLVAAGGFADAATEAADREATLLVCDWFSRVCSAYRTDDSLFPGAKVTDQPILTPDQQAEWGGEEALPEALANRVQRAIGQIELYALTVHGEQRDGNFDHGPYPGANGEQIVFHEINDLDNDFLPWIEPEQRLGVEAVGIVRAFDPEVEITCDIFGTSSVAPSDAEFRQLRVLTRADGELRDLPIEELEELADRASRATGELYARIAAWEQDYRTGYGGPLFLNHLAPFLRIAGAEEAEQWLRGVRDHAGRRDLALVGAAGAEQWSRLAAGGEIFTPLAVGRE